MASCAEHLAVVDADSSEPLAIWASRRRSPIELGGIRYYRLDYFEVSPVHRGSSSILSIFALGLVAARALELTAVGMVLVTLDIGGLEEFYIGTGATRGVPSGWNSGAGLLGFTFGHSALLGLATNVDGFIKET